MNKSISTDKRLLEAIDYIDQKYIDEVAESYEVIAIPGEYVRDTRRLRRAYVKALAAAACLVLVAGLMSAAPTIWSELKTIIPGMSVSGTEQLESENPELDELLKNVDICPTSEPVALSEDEINNIVAAYLATEPEEDRQKAYTVKCFGKHDDVYAIDVIGWSEYIETMEEYQKVYDIMLRELGKYTLEYYIYNQNEIFTVGQAATNNMLSAKQFIEYSENCFNYTGQEVIILTAEQVLADPTNLDYHFADKRSLGNIIEVPHDILKQIVYLEVFYYFGGSNFTVYLPKCFFEKDGSYTYICDYSAVAANFADAYRKLSLNGCEFFDPYSECIYVLNNGERYLLDEAYKLGIIDSEYIKELYEVYMQGNWWGIKSNKEIKEFYEKFEPDEYYEY